jgi:hypothetical protein
MKRVSLLSGLSSGLLSGAALLGLLLIPDAAHAQYNTQYQPQPQCAPPGMGSATVTCEQGVRVIRQNPLPAPRLDPATVERLKLERQRLADQRAASRRQARIDAQALKLERERVRNEGYLYRDANSPLRGRRGRSNSTVVVPNR